MTGRQLAKLFHKMSIPRRDINQDYRSIINREIEIDTPENIFKNLYSPNFVLNFANNEKFNCWFKNWVTNFLEYSFEEMIATKDQNKIFIYEVRLDKYEQSVNYNLAKINTLGNRAVVTEKKLLLVINNTINKKNKVKQLIFNIYSDSIKNWINENSAYLQKELLKDFYSWKSKLMNELNDINNLIIECQNNKKKIIQTLNILKTKLDDLYQNYIAKNVFIRWSNFKLKQEIRGLKEQIEYEDNYCNKIKEELKNLNNNKIEINEILKFHY